MWPFSARSRTSSKPIPVLAPVTRITFEDMAELFFKDVIRRKALWKNEMLDWVDWRAFISSSSSPPLRNHRA